MQVKIDMCKQTNQSNIAKMGEQKEKKQVYRLNKRRIYFQQNTTVVKML